MDWKRNSTTQKNIDWWKRGQTKKGQQERIKNKWEAICEEMIAKTYSTISDINS